MAKITKIEPPTGAGNKPEWEISEYINLAGLMPV